MKTINHEKLIKEIKERIGSLDVRDNIERRVYEIALASLEAEPVAWLHSGNGLSIPSITGSKNVADGWLSRGRYVQPLYIAQPVPAVPEEMYWPGAPVEGSSKAAAYATGWNACRAAMLHSGNFRENTNSSTNDCRETVETSTNSPVIPGEVLSAILKFARVRADFDDFDCDRRGIGDCLDEAEQELIVTINKYASQLAVEPVVPDDVLEQTVASPAPGNQVSELTMLVKRLASSLKSVNKSSKLPDKAMEYLKQNGLVGVEDILR
ncbi:TPA: hypothetical protein ACG0O1_002419 [Escherichia coli]